MKHFPFHPLPRLLVIFAMKLRVLMLIALGLCVCSCANPAKKKKDKKSNEPTINDAAGDVSFQSYVGILRKAVAARDMQTVASMMTENFGYRLEPPGEGEGVFKYWDENGLWKELELTLKEKFVPMGAYMVAPPQFATEENYHGYRAGIANVNGSWKFAYFVKD